MCCFIWRLAFITQPISSYTYKRLVKFAHHVILEPTVKSEAFPMDRVINQAPILRSNLSYGEARGTTAWIICLFLQQKSDTYEVRHNYNYRYDNVDTYNK